MHERFRRDGIVEVSVKSLRRLKRVGSIVFAVSLVLASSMTGCGKKEIHQGGEDTNFPYTWQEESKGRILVTVDGSYGDKNYRWVAESSDESILKVSVAKKEKKGKASYHVKPVGEGAADIKFIRQRAVEEPEPSKSEDDAAGQAGAVGAADAPGAEGSSGLNMSGGVADVMNESLPAAAVAGDGQVEAGEAVEAAEAVEEPPEEMEADGDGLREEELDASELARLAQQIEQYETRFQARDAIAELTIRFDVEKTEKKGKLQAILSFDNLKEYSGIMQSEADNLDYRLWEDTTGALLLKFPDQDEWTYSWEGEYIPPEADDTPGIMTEKLQQEDGRDVILEINNSGFMDGVQCFTVEGLAPGIATVTFTNTVRGSRVIVEIAISNSHKITVTSHRVEG